MNVDPFWLHDRVLPSEANDPQEVARLAALWQKSGKIPAINLARQEPSLSPVPSPISAMNSGESPRILRFVPLMFFCNHVRMIPRE